MSGPTVPLQHPDAARFAPFGRFVVPPDMPGERQFYSDMLYLHPDGSAPVLHVNHVTPQTLPAQVSKVERHPYAAQCFFPIDVSRYIVVVMPSDGDGRPQTDHALAFLLPGTMGVIYSPGVWHMGAKVLDRLGHFAVLMWRGGPQHDDEFRTIAPISIIDPT
jgi:ureidoglycolate lyase